MALDNIFAQASKSKIRFEGLGKGVLTTEDLWDLKAEILNEAAKVLDVQIKQSAQVGYLDDVSEVDSTLILKRDILVYIIKYKRQERVDAGNNAAKSARRKELEAALAVQKAKALEGMTQEEILAELNSL